MAKVGRPRLNEDEREESRKAQIKTANDFVRNNYDRFSVNRPKGDKEKLKKIAKQKGFPSVNDFINTCIDEKLKRYKIDLDNM